MAVEHQHGKGFPVIHGVRWFNVAVLVFTPLTALYGLCFVGFDRRTFTFAIAYFFFTVFGETLANEADFKNSSLVYSGITAG
jgi:hypothetical protein